MFVVRISWFLQKKNILYCFNKNEDILKLSKNLQKLMDHDEPNMIQNIQFLIVSFSLLWWKNTKKKKK